ncbi:MAG: hypothetical protein E7062_10850 [Spirochaetaceae bacterium]|nr:hypothetical protein [Spirochaetaceae bacterium]
MADINDFENNLYKALEERTNWFDTTVLPPILEDYRVLHSCVTNLINILVQKGTITPDPYRLDKKISDVEVPDESDFSDSDRNMKIGVRLSDYERVIDFLCNYFKFSVKMLSLERIKKLVALNNYFQWGSMVPTSPQQNTKGLAEIFNQTRQGADTISISVINGGISQAAKITAQINSVLKQVTELQREIYKAEIRKKIINSPSFPADKITSSQAGVLQVKKMFTATMGKQHFYSELIEEIFIENSPEGEKRRQQILDKLKIVVQTKEKKAVQINTKNLIMEAVRTLSALAPQLNVIVEKMEENHSIIESEHQGLWEKFKKAFRKAFGIKEKPVEYIIPITDTVTQTTHNEKVNFQKNINDITKRFHFYNSFATRQTPGYQKIESESEAQILAFLTKQLSECQQLLSILAAYDKFFKNAVQPINRNRVKGMSMELTSIKNTLVKTNQRKAEYSAYMEEQQQMKKLGITDVL